MTLNDQQGGYIREIIDEPGDKTVHGDDDLIVVLDGALAEGEV